jgi:hypothetical protein
MAVADLCGLGRAREHEAAGEGPRQSERVT